MKDELLFITMKSYVKKASDFNRLYLTDKEIEEVVEQMWYDHDFIGYCVSYTSRYYENKYMKS